MNDQPVSQRARKPIPKRIRFEVFKRDGFKCQYCGASAPDVLLQVDHIKPAAAGGEDDIINLIV
jgi:5-methylcytosine-specific restriction endonuclease McrA